MSATVLAITAVGYVAVVIGCWVKVAADYRYNTLRGWYSDRAGFAIFSNRPRVERAVNHAALSVIWPVWIGGLAVSATFLVFVNAAGRLGERRVLREDAAYEGDVASS